MEEGMRITNTESTSVVSAEILKQTMELCLTGMITKIETDSELQNSYKLLTDVKKTAADLRSEYDKKAEPISNQLTELREAYFPLIKQLTGEKMDNKGGIAANLSSVTALYVMEQERKAEEKRKADQKIIDDAKAAEALKEQQKIEEAEKLEKAAAVETDADKKTDLLRAADTANTEALKASEQVAKLDEVVAEAPKAFIPSGMKKPKMEYTAQVNDHWKALLWLIANEGKGHIEGRSDFKKAVEGAMNAVAKAKGIDFKADGCVKISTPKAK